MNGRKMKKLSDQQIRILICASDWRGGNLRDFRRELFDRLSGQGIELTTDWINSATRTLLNNGYLGEINHTVKTPRGAKTESRLYLTEKGRKSIWISQHCGSRPIGPEVQTDRQRMGATVRNRGHAGSR